MQYTVKKGDNLTSIARKYGISLAKLRQANKERFRTKKSMNLIYVGEILNIPEPNDNSKTPKSVVTNMQTERGGIVSNIENQNKGGRGGIVTNILRGLELNNLELSQYVKAPEEQSFEVPSLTPTPSKSHTALLPWNIVSNDIAESIINNGGKRINITSPFAHLYNEDELDVLSSFASDYGFNLNDIWEDLLGRSLVYGQYGDDWYIFEDGKVPIVMESTVTDLPAQVIAARPAKTGPGQIDGPNIADLMGQAVYNDPLNPIAKRDENRNIVKDENGKVVYTGEYHNVFNSPLMGSNADDQLAFAAVVYAAKLNTMKRYPKQNLSDLDAISLSIYLDDIVGRNPKVTANDLGGKDNFYINRNGELDILNRSKIKRNRLK